MRPWRAALLSGESPSLQMASSLAPAAHKAATSRLCMGGQPGVVGSNRKTKEQVGARQRGDQGTNVAGGVSR